MQLNTGTPFRLGASIKEIYHNEGFRGYFKGVLAPVVGRAPIASILFSGNGFAKRELEKYDFNINLKNYLAGLFAGVCYTNSAFIFDLLKIRA